MDTEMARLQAENGELRFRLESMRNELHAPKPNLIERMENLIHSLDEAREFISNPGVSGNRVPDALNSIDNASGIAGEILTMIDGR